MDGPPDIASNKLLALFGRAMLRDFLDVYVLVRQGGFSQAVLIEQAERKDPGFDRYWFGVALERIKTFPEAAPELLMLITPVAFGEVREFFIRWRDDIMRGLVTS